MGEPLLLLPRASSWKLGEDAALLEAMQGLATSITSGSKQLHERMDRLAKETASAYTRLLTTQNNFVQLSNVKFIEARVYEDSEEAVDDQNVNVGKTKEEAPSEETQISEALECGVKLLEAAFEKVEIEDSDSDEEESSKMISVMQPKNPFHIRSLPAVIGSKAWVEDDKIGLVEEEADEAEEDELSSDEEIIDHQRVQKDDSEYSQSDVEDSHSVPQPANKSGPVVAKQSVLDQSDSEFSDDEDDELFKPKLAPPVKLHVKPDSDDVEGSTTGHDEDSLRESEEEKEVGTQSNNAFSHELSKKLGLAPTQPTGDGAEAQAAEQIPSKTPQKPAPTKKSLLFDSSDSEDDLFSGKPALPKKAAKPKPSTVSEKMVPPLPPAAEKPKETRQDEQPEPREDLSPRSPSTPKAQTTTPKKDASVKKSLFGSSSEDDDDDIFANIMVKTAEPITKPVIAATDDPSDSDDNIFSPKEKTSSTNDEIAMSDNSDKELSLTSAKKPFGGISMFGAGFKPTSVLKKQQIDPNFKTEGTDDEEDDEDLFNTAIKAPATKTPLPTSKPKETDKDDLKLQEADEGDDTSQSDMRSVNSVDSSFLNVAKQELKSKETSNEVPEASAMEEDSVEEDAADSGVSLSAADIEAPVLTTLTKSRVKGTAGRRPPSRSARKKAVEATSTTIEKEDEADEGMAASPRSSVREINNETKTTDEDEAVTAVTAKKPIGGISMFGAGFNPAAALKSMKSRTDDQDALSETVVEQEKKVENMPIKEQDVTTNNNEVEPSELDKNKDDNDIFSETMGQNETTSGTLFDKHDDDNLSMFAAPSKLQHSNHSADSTALGSTVAEDEEHAATASSLFDDDNEADDMFNTPPKLDKSNDQVKKKKDIFGFDEDDSDDDLFSNMASGVKPSLKPNPLANILGDDSDDDLFSSLIPKSTK